MRRSIVVSAPRCGVAGPGPGRCARPLAGSGSDALQPLPTSWLLDFRVIFSFRAIATVARVGSPAPGHVASVFLQAGNTRRVLDDAGGQVGLLRLEFGPQCRQLRLERGLEPRERPLATVELLLLDQRRGVLAGLAAQARGSGEDADGARVDVDQLDAVVREEKLTNLVGVAHPAGLEHVEPAVSLAARLERHEPEPGIDDRRDRGVRPFNLGLAVRETGHERGDPGALEEVDEAHQRAMDVRGG